MRAMADAPLMVTLSGIRGIAGVSLTPDVVTKYVRGFCTTQLRERPGNAVFVLYDYALTGLISTYVFRFRHVVRKTLHLK